MYQLAVYLGGITPEEKTGGTRKMNYREAKRQGLIKPQQIRKLERI